MAYRKYNLNGREMLNLDNRGMVDYDEYYIILGKSFERRSDITSKYQTIQNTDLIENEPSIEYSMQYNQFLEGLKSVNLEMYSKKVTLLENYLTELNEEESMFRDEKNQLLSKGYPFDSNMKKYGYYIIEVDNNYFQYKRVVENSIKVDMGDNLLPQNVNISSLELVPITLEELQIIKMNVLRKNKLSEQITGRRC